MCRLELKCDDRRKSIFKGLHLIISCFISEDEQDFYRFCKQILIPLSFSEIYLHWIYPHLGKCHKDFRSKWYIGKAREDRE